MAKPEKADVDVTGPDPLDELSEVVSAMRSVVKDLISAMECDTGSEESHKALARAKKNARAL